MNARLYAAATLAAVLAVAAPAWAADGHDHSGGPGLTELVLDNGAKWPTDAPLRQGMDDILRDFGAALPAIHRGEMADAGYAALADAVHGHLEGVFANCKLPPEADAQLHIVLAQVIGGVEAMKDGPDRKAGAVRIVRALDAYAGHFDHPGWTPPAH